MLGFLVLLLALPFLFQRIGLVLVLLLVRVLLFTLPLG